jgi:hypothetical protein
MLRIFTRRNLRCARRLVPRDREKHHGTKIFEKSIGQGRARNEEAQKRDLEKWPLGPESEEPQAGHCDRSIRGKGGRAESPEEDRQEEKERQETEVEEIARRLPRQIVMAGHGCLKPCPAMMYLKRGRRSHS